MSKILIFNWKDINHPNAGGAEVVIHELAKRLVKNGHETTILTAQYPDSDETDVIDGINIIRVPGGRVTHSFKAVAYYIKNLRNKFDIIVEQVNTAPYFISYFSKKEKVFQFYHQLAREIWFFEFPFLVNLIGYLFLEPIALILQSTITRLKGIKIITISNSSKQDLKRFGFAQSNIHIISEGIENEPIDKLEDSLPKESNFTVLFHSSLRDMKRPIEVFKSFNLFLKKFKSNSETPTSHSEPDLESTNKKITPKLWISGGGDQSKLLKYAEDNGFIDNVVFYGRTTDEQKFELMQRAHVISSTSIKEGWGLIVTEANSQGTPAISYDVDGLRDSTRFGGGIVVKPNSESMSKALIDLQKMVEDRPNEYLELRQSALSSAKKITFEQSYKDFKSIIEI